MSGAHIACTAGKFETMSKESNIIYIGRKPPMNYVLAVITSFNVPNTKEVVLKARGQAISTAIDVAEITRRRFMKELNVDEITIGTEEMPPREGENRARNISTMEITLKLK
jgi:DNA-binding protein